jgi:hypothetical protein
LFFCINRRVLGHHSTSESITDSTGPTDAAVAELDESLKLWEELAPASAGYRYYLGDALRVQGNVFRLQMKLAESEASLLRSKEILEAVVKQSDTADNKDVLADSLRDLAATRQAAGDKAAALDLLQQAVALETAACALSPTSRELQESLMQLQQRLTGIQRLD